MSALPAVFTTSDPTTATVGLWLLINALAIARIARLIARDTVTNGARHRIQSKAEGSLVELLTCPWCLGIWLAAAATVLTCAASTRGWWLIVASGFAIAELAGLLNELG
jgi:hypothetical protein